MQKATSTRLDFVDALRGFALLGIIIVHFIEQYYAGGAPKGHENFEIKSVIDEVFMGITNLLIRGKFFMLFSFLFGLSFSLQMQHAEERGVNFQGRFIWRLIILFAIGVVHHLFYRGDILTVFALCGLPMVLFYKVPDRWLLATFAVFMLGVPRVIIAFNSTNAIFQPNEALQKAEEVYWAAVKSGSLWDVFWQNLTLGTQSKWDAQFGFFGRGYQTFALFLLGLYAGRTRFFENMGDKMPLYRKGLFWSLGIFFGSFAIGAALYMGLKIQERFGEKIANSIGLLLYDISNVAHTAFYVFGLLLLFRKQWWQRLFLKLAPYGRMALTNYVGQTLIGTTLLFGFGFGKLGDFGAATMTVCAIVVFVLQRYFSEWWLNRFHFGPLEWLWRSLTFLKIQPFVKSNVEN
jgi:uncharacterized protein